MPRETDPYFEWNRYFAYILKKYSITEEAFTAVWERQGGKCGICHQAARLVTDHDHKTKRFRGLLCYYCNGMLGKIQKHPSLLKNIPEYLGWQP